jgi:3-dehydroquinate dehydratase II
LTRIFVLNGVNLGSLGTRQPEIYGEQTLQDIEQLLHNAFPDVEFEFRQTDHEGELVGWIHDASDSDGLVLNPGAWTHYSYAIHDALKIVSVPKVEVHISNVHSRGEEWRGTSVVSSVVDAVVAGMGVYGYRAAVGYILAAAARD